MLEGGRSRGAGGRWRGCLLVIIIVLDLAFCFILPLRLELLVNDVIAWSWSRLVDTLLWLL